MSKTKDPKQITRVIPAKQSAYATVSSSVNLELIPSTNQTTGAEEVEKVLVINPR